MNTDGGTKFPWDFGVYDAHCHPTDTMAAMPAIPSMKARVLTVMSTRAQDQDLVATAAQGHPGLDFQQCDSTEGKESACKFLPSFGWHPWFSYQLYDETMYDGATSLSEEQKSQHYKSVMTPVPEDENFIKALPDPVSLCQFIDETRERLIANPLALVGEIGFDKAFRIPIPWAEPGSNCKDAGLTPGGREGRRLSPHRVAVDHQKLVLTRQLNLAGELGRAVSVHGVGSPGVFHSTVSATWKGHEKPNMSNRQKRAQMADNRTKIDDLALKVEEGKLDEHVRYHPKPFPPRICLHSYSGGPPFTRQWLDKTIPADVFFSFSMVVNFEGPRPDESVETVKKIPDDRILVESDLHVAGEEMDMYLEKGVRKICEIKGWGLEEGVKILGRNWKRFVFGQDPGV
ncbi:Cut9-interacting protein scn1 [Sphaceloma murrayae]|uniref:Cut9-interacting protein scn1 n=1 Tax=Sphaceloma murrayae TaxID=2082308 RepID=A0A2K1R154_9PEZI|nr:Cut9-interacting protein scn1 [Sphaceloma murrayae]